MVLDRANVGAEQHIEKVEAPKRDVAAVATMTHGRPVQVRYCCYNIGAGVTGVLVVVSASRRSRIQLRVTSFSIDIFKGHVEE
jgi:hypothetical protein